MSFRADDQRRYGQVPPVQYPVAGQRPERHPVGRRLSFNTGDDAAYHGDQASDGPPAPARAAQRSGADELFLHSPAASSSAIGRPPFTPTDAGFHPDTAPRTPPGRPSYNPQVFTRASGAAFHRSPTSTVSPQSHPSRYAAGGNSLSNSGFAPQTYNPAAYANTNSAQRQPTYPGYGHEQGYGAATGPGPSAVYRQAPGATYSAPVSQQPLPTSPSSFPRPGSSDQAPTYDPSRYAAGFYPGHGSGADGQGSVPYSVSQAPYLVSSHIPVGPNHDFDDSASFYSSRFRSDSQTSRGASSQSAALHRHPTHAPLPSRPMDDLIDEEVYWDSNGRPLGREPSIDGMTSESIMQEIEAELGDDGRWPRRRPSPINGQLAREQAEQLRRGGTAGGLHSPSASQASPGAGQRPVDYDDDPEATAGLLAMRQAELDDQRFSGNVFMYSNVPAPVPSNPLPPPPEDDDTASDGELGGPVDLGMLSGGYAGNLTYGPGIGPLTDSSIAIEGSRPLPTPGYYASFNGGWNAEMDYGGTGGLQPPRAHRLSFDESRDESVSLHSRQSGADSPTKIDVQDPTSLQYPGLSHRPLPALPPGPDSDSSSMLSAHNSLSSQHQRHHSLSADARYYQTDPEKFYQANAQQTPQPERSISLSGHSHTPQVQAPTRSRTDAAEERKKMTRQQMIGLHGPGFPESEVGSGSFDGIVLPTGRKKKFVPSKLTASDFRKCREPWALSGIEAWVRSMGDAEVDLRQKTVEEAVTNLFAFKVPTMNVADAEMLSSRVVRLMLESGTLVPDEEWVKFGEDHISGVLWQMTGSGCYAPKVHDFETAGYCYSRHCSRSSKRMFLGSLLLEHEEENDWRVFHKLKPEDYEGRSNKELQLQFNLHEVVTGERTYLYQLKIFHALYRDELRTRDPAVIHPDKIEKFLATVFRKLDTIFDINKDHLLSPLRYRRQEQAPWVVGFSDIFREWIRKAKADYLEFATGYPRAAYMIRKEADRNILFKKFIDDRQRHKLSSKQDWTHFLFQPIQRLQRYPLLLEAVEKLMLGESEERTNLAKAIQEIRAVVLECDTRVAETTKRVQMMELDRMLVLRPGFQSVLNLDHLGRVLIKEGELQRMGSKGVRWVDTHALLFDHYLILAKIVVYKDSKGEKKYDVSREPIPMPLLFLESMNDEPVTKQKVIAAPLGRTAAAPASSAHLHKSASNGSGRQGVEHAATGSSTNSMGAQSSHDSEGKILYPFKLKHLGYEVYTLYASSAQNRLDWCTSIIEAKTRHAKALFSQNAEPFRLRVLADASFHYDASSMYARVTGVPVKGTPLDRALQGIEDAMGSAQGIAPVCRAQVNCAAGFSAFGKSVIAIGTDYGVYVSDPSEPRGWRRTVQTARVTQIAILEEFSVCLVLADKSLISYPLDVVAPSSDFAPPINDTSRRAPQRLAKDVTYFATARMKERMLVFYKRKEGLHTSFKVLEPILHKASEKKSRLFGGRRPAAGITDTFRDFDEFYLPIDCYSLSVFHTYIAVSTAKGIEMLTLDKKQPMSIPDLKAQTIANIALRIRDQRPLGMFRLNDNEFILTYEDCAVYVDKHGDVSRTLIMEYTGKQKKARGATMYGQYLLLFNDDYVEVRNAENGRLRQIIAGRDVRVLDFGIRGPTGGNAAESQQSLLGQNGQPADTGEVSKGTVKIVMCHPELPGKQIVLEMLLNDGHAE